MASPKEIVTVLSVVIISLGVMLMINSAQQIAEPVIDCSGKIDSLENEIFIRQTNLGRYEMALEILKEEDSVAADHFEHILSKQTE
jgi:hypothetical protein